MAPPARTVLCLARAVTSTLVQQLPMVATRSPAKILIIAEHALSHVIPIIIRVDLHVSHVHGMVIL